MAVNINQRLVEYVSSHLKNMGVMSVADIYTELVSIVGVHFSSDTAKATIKIHVKMALAAENSYDGSVSKLSWRRKLYRRRDSISKILLERIMTYRQRILIEDPTAQTQSPQLSQQKQGDFIDYIFLKLKH